MPEKADFTIEEFKKTNFYKNSTFDKKLMFPNNRDWNFICRHYDNWLSINNNTAEVKIPHIIHQLWVGSPLPEKYKEWCKSWQELNPDWKYILWTDENLSELFNEEEMNWFQNSKNFGPKSDLFRYTALYKFGGIYCDTDFECVKNFDFLTRNCTFISANQVPNDLDIGSALVASTKNHILMKIIHDELLKVDIKNLKEIDILNVTGPGFLTDIIMKNKDLLLATDVILPAKYLYPFPNSHRKKRYSPSKIKTKYCTEVSYALHYWEMSWATKNLIKDFWIYFKAFVKKIIFFEKWRKYIKK